MSSKKINALTKIEAGHYKSAKGEVRNVNCGSGAPWVRDAHNPWLVTLADGRKFFVPTLSRAREMLL